MDTLKVRAMCARRGWRCSALRNPEIAIEATKKKREVKHV